MPLKNPEASQLTGNVNFVFVETLVDVHYTQTEGRHEMFEAFHKRVKRKIAL
jgi:hypothetical protein